MLDFLSWSTSGAAGTRRIFLSVDGGPVVWVAVAGEQDTTEGGASSPLPNIAIRSGHAVCIDAPIGDGIIVPRLHGFLVKDS